MDIVDFLEDHGVDVSISGKNVANGWIGIQCLYCDDQTNHLGIRLNDLKTTCWKCGGHSILTVLGDITGLSRREIMRLVKTFEDATYTYEQYNQDIPRNRRVLKNLKIAVPEVDRKIPLLHYRYLKGRGFNPRYITRKYDLSFVSTIGEFKFRIIIPYYFKRRLYSFTSRAIDERMVPKYLHPKNFSIPLSPKDMVYNLDELKPDHDCVITEGPVDVWRFGEGAVALAGTGQKKNQIVSLIDKKIRNLFILLDYDITQIDGTTQKPRTRQTKKKSLDIYAAMKGRCENIEILTYKGANDLGSMTEKQVLELKQALRFNEGR